MKRAREPGPAGYFRKVLCDIFGLEPIHKTIIEYKEIKVNE